MKKSNLKKVSSLLVLTILLQGIAPSYGAEITPLNSGDEITVANPSATAAPADVVINIPPASDPFFYGDASNARGDVTDYRQQKAKLTWKFYAAMGTVFATLATVGILGGLGLFKNRSGQDSQTPTPPFQFPEISTINFSNYEWSVKKDVEKNLFASTTDAIFLDQDGNLNLKVLQSNNIWKSTEVKLPQSLGYGVYNFEIKTSSADLDTKLVNSALIYQDDSHAFNLGLSKWLDPSAPYAASFDVEPADAEGNHFPFQPLSPASEFVNYRMNWTKTQIQFDARVNDAVIASASFKYKGKFNFAPGNESVVLKHWIFNATAPADQHEHAMVIKSFSFTPAAQQ